MTKQMLKFAIKKICSKSMLEVYYFLERKKRYLKYRQLIKKTHEHYKDVVERIKNRGDRPLRFASYVVFDSTFGASGLMKLMLSDLQHYSPKIVICPDVVRGEDHLKEQYKKTKNFFINKYGAEYVVDGYDEQTGVFLDVSEQFDMIYCANPYDAMVNKVHGVQYLSSKNVLPIFINYGYSISRWHFTCVEQSLELSLFYKYFADTTYTLKEIKKYNLNRGRHVFLSGYSKMDELSKYPSKQNNKIKILLAPHHTIKGMNEAFQLSNFLTYYELIKRLPDIYTDVDFVFRPHPLLFVNLVNKKIWSQKQVDDYINDIKRKGVIYSIGGDYISLFSECDAIIHDCGSYMVEWLYTDKPCCFVVEDEKKLKNQLCLLGNKAIGFHVLAHNESEILDFINKVKNRSYTKFANDEVKRNIMINYPHVSDYILSNLFK